jgi:hypothetical protein
LFSGLNEQMTQAFTGVSQAVSNITEQASQLATTSTAIAQDARTLLALGFTEDNLETHQTRSNNLRRLSLIPRLRAQTITALHQLEGSNRRAEHLNWGSIVREFMRMIDSGELTFEVRFGTTGQPQRRRESNATPVKQPEPEKLPPTRFEREDVI